MTDWGVRCDVCGWCATPGRCVWSVACPRCEAARGQPCRTPGTTRLEGLHEERWEASGTTWRLSLVELGTPGVGRSVLVVDVEAPSGHGDVRPGPDLSGATVIKLEDWEDLKRIEEFLAEEPSGVDFHVIDSLTEMQRRITEEVAR